MSGARASGSGSGDGRPPEHPQPGAAGARRRPSDPNAAPGRPLLAILADDLTGACDAAAPFARRGLHTEVLLDADHPRDVADGVDVLAVDADTRRLRRSVAAGRTRGASAALRARGAGLLFKKIDSTLRGHVAAELAATLRAWDDPLAVLCPAFPAVGRWVQDGHLFVDKRGDLGDVATLAGLDDAAIGRRVARLGLRVVGEGAGAVTEFLARARSEGARVVIADANTPGHLNALAVAATGLTIPALLVGSAGLAGALADVLPIRPDREGASARHERASAVPDPSSPLPPGGKGGAPLTSGGGRRVPDPAGAMPWLVVCGSQTEVTRHQIVELARAGAAVVELAAAELLARRGAADEAGARAARLLWSGTTPVLRLVVPPDADGVPSLGPRLDDRAARVLAQACRAAVGGARPAGLFLTGGLTARECLLALGARGLRLEQEPLPGIASGRALGGAWDGRAVITKSGGFGAPDAIKRLVRPRRP